MPNEWRIYFPDSDTVEPELFDLEVVDAVNRYARSITPIIDDDDGSAITRYPQGRRIEADYSTDGGSTWTRRAAGFVQNSIQKNEQGIETLEVQAVGYDQLLRRQEVFKDYSSTAISSIIQDLVENFTSVTYSGAAVSVVNDDTIDASFNGERVDQCLQELSALSANEEFGVDDDFTFFFRQRDTEQSPVDITDDDADVLDFDLPREARRTVNRVRVFYGEGASRSSVVVEDRANQRELGEKLNTSGNVVFSDSVNYPQITDESVAKHKATRYLGEFSPIQTGEVTTFDRFTLEAGDVFRLQIQELGIDTDYRAAQLEYRWREDETFVTVAESSREGTDEILTELSDDVSRIDTRSADADADFTQFLDMRSGAEATVDGQIIQRTQDSTAYTPGFDSGGTSNTFGFGGGSTAGFAYTSRTETEIDFTTTAVYEQDSFETGTYVNRWTDESETNASPDVNTDRAKGGQYSLDLTSIAGGDTINGVATKDVYRGPGAYTCYINRYNSSGAQEATYFRLRATDSDAFLELYMSEFFDPAARIREYDEDGTEILDTGFADPLTTGEWTPAEIEVKSGSVVASYDGTSQEVNTTKDWTQEDVQLFLRANGFGGGNNIESAWDSITITAERKDTAGVITTSLLNGLRDGWQGDTPPAITHMGIGDGSGSVSRADTTLEAEATRRTFEQFYANGSTQVRGSITLVPSGGFVGQSITEAGWFTDAGGSTLQAQAQYPSVTHQGDTRTTIQLDVDYQTGSLPGVITDAGQTALQQITLGETGQEPVNMLYGTGTSPAETSDTALDTEVLSRTIDSFADRGTGLTSIVERLGTGQGNGNDISEIGEEDSGGSLLARVVIDAISKTSDFALETDHQFIIQNE